MRKALFTVLLALPACAALIDLGDEPESLLSDGGGIVPDVVSPSDSPSDVTSTEAGPPPPFVDTTFGTGGFVSVDRAVGIAAAGGDAGQVFVLGTANQSLALFHLSTNGADAGIVVQPRAATNSIEFPQRMRVSQSGELLLAGDGQDVDAGHGPVAYLVAPDGVQNITSIRGATGASSTRTIGLCGRGTPNMVMTITDVGSKAIGLFSQFESTFQEVETASGADMMRVLRNTEPYNLACVAAFPLEPPGTVGVRFRMFADDAGSRPATEYTFANSALDVGIDGGAISVDLAPTNDNKTVLVVGQTMLRDAFFMTLNVEGLGSTSTVTQRPLDTAFALNRAVANANHIYLAGCTDAPSRHPVIFRFSTGDLSRDVSFGQNGRIDLEGPSGECALDLAIDPARKLYVLLGPRGDNPITTRVTRLLPTD